MVRRARLLTKEQVKAPFQSKEAFIDFVRAPDSLEGHARIGDSRWSNRDLEPTPPEHRNWTWYNLPLYWFSNQFSLTGWNTGSSLVAVGLSWQYSFASCVLGALIAAVVVVLMARPGVQYHIGYPVLCRASMGMYGSYFFVFIRAIVCIIWYGIQTYYGAAILSVMFRCIFGSAWTNFQNTLSASADVTSSTLLAFFIVWILEFPFMWVHPRHIHYIFTVKGFTMPIAAFALFGWCLHNGAGLSGLGFASRAAQATAPNIPVGWSIMSGINVIMGGLSPMLVNQPDLARYCQKPRDAGISQGIVVFVTTVLVFFLGIAATTSIQGIWGTAYWNIWDMLSAILDHHWTPGARAGVFFVGLAFLLGVFATNFGANSIPFGSDMTGLFPKFLTIRRGQIVCSILGIVVMPWKLIASASAFLSFLGSYNIFMAPLCAVIIVDYWLVRSGNIHVPSLYDGSKRGLYWFWSGTNWCGVFAWIAGTTMGIPGLIGQYQPEVISDAARRMYMMGYILTFVTAAVVYSICTRFAHFRVFPAGREHMPVQREWLAKEGREGFFEGEREGLEGLEIEAPSTPHSVVGEEVNLKGEKGVKM
ncbi:Allantoin permease [Exophiala dermatitidis]